MTFKPLFGPITKLSLSFVTFRVSRFPVSHLTHETVKLGLQNTLNMSKTTKVYFGVLHLRHPEPQPLRGFLLRLIHLHNLLHMKGEFLSMEVRGESWLLVGVNGNKGKQVQQVPQQPFGQPAPVLDLAAIREAVRELYRPCLMKIGHPKFYKPYLEMIYNENPYLRGYRIPDFSLFFGEDGQSTLEHVARFTVQCGELANYENFYHFKLRLFLNSLTRALFTWYTTLLRNSIRIWQEMERKFHTQFFNFESKVCIEKLSRVTQRNEETTDMFISRFKKMINRCKIHLLETEYVKMARRGLDIELRKKFQGMQFRDFYELIVKVTEYEELLKEESYRGRSPREPIVKR